MLSVLQLIERHGTLNEFEDAGWATGCETSTDEKISAICAYAKDLALAAKADAQSGAARSAEGRRG